MSPLSTDISGRAETAQRLGEIAAAAEDALWQALVEAAAQLRDEAAANAERFAQSGQLAASVETEAVTPHAHIVAARAPYALYVEFGTRNMAPRPFLSTALFHLREELTAQIEDAVAAALGEP